MHSSGRAPARATSRCFRACVNFPSNGCFFLHSFTLLSGPYELFWVEAEETRAEKSHFGGSIPQKAPSLEYKIVKQDLWTNAGLRRDRCHRKTPYLVGMYRGLDAAHWAKRAGSTSRRGLWRGDNVVWPWVPLIHPCTWMYTQAHTHTQTQHFQRVSRTCIDTSLPLGLSPPIFPHTPIGR